MKHILMMTALLAILVMAVAGCSRFSSSQEAAAHLGNQFVKYGSHTRGNCSYEFKDFALAGGAVSYKIERICTGSEPPSHSIFSYRVDLDDLEPDAPTGKIDDDGEPMFFAHCKRDLHCVDIVERYENDPRGASGEVDAEYLSVMFRLSHDIPKPELKDLGRTFRRMMQLEAKGR